MSDVILGRFQDGSSIAALLSREFGVGFILPTLIWILAVQVGVCFQWCFHGLNTPPSFGCVPTRKMLPSMSNPSRKSNVCGFNTPMTALDFATEMYKMCPPASYGWHCWCFELQRKSTPCSATFGLLVMWEGWNSFLLQQRYVASFLFVVMGIFNVILAVYVSRLRVTWQPQTTEG